MTHLLHLSNSSISQVVTHSENHVSFLSHMALLISVLHILLNMMQKAPNLRLKMSSATNFNFQMIVFISLLSLGDVYCTLGDTRWKINELQDLCQITSLSRIILHIFVPSSNHSFNSCRKTFLWLCYKWNHMWRSAWIWEWSWMWGHLCSHIYVCVREIPDLNIRDLWEKGAFWAARCSSSKGTLHKQDVWTTNTYPYTEAFFSRQILV